MPKRRIAARAPQDSGASAGQAHHRIVTGAHDGPVVHQEMVGDVFQADGGFFIGDRDRLVAAVAAGGDQREPALLHQQMMQRRVRQHDAEIGRAMRNVPGDVGAGLGLQQHDGRGLRFEQLALRRARFRSSSRATSSDGIISANGFSSRCLRWRRRATASRIAGIGQKLESSNAFERDDFSLQQRLDRIFDRAVELRAADRAGIGLGVKAAVRRILVFFAAGGTQHELAHRRVGPVVRNVDDDGVTRAAVGAVGEGIFKAAVARDRTIPRGSRCRWRGRAAR